LPSLLLCCAQTVSIITDFSKTGIFSFGILRPMIFLKVKNMSRLREKEESASNLLKFLLGCVKLTP